MFDYLVSIFKRDKNDIRLIQLLSHVNNIDVHLKSIITNHVKNILTSDDRIY